MNRYDFNHKTIQGVDVDLEISLKEYGFAWVEAESEILFYYGIKHNDEDYVRFDTCIMSKDLGIKKEYDWIDDWEGINSYIGQDIDGLPLPEQIKAIFDYSGYESTFGSSYWEGVTYGEIEGLAKAPRKARIWIWWNKGWCRITIQVGKTITLHSFEETEEGNSWEHWEYSFDGELIHWQHASGGRDCDGNISYHHDFASKYGETVERRNNKGVVVAVVPDWKEKDSWQRDQYAELDGY